MLNEEKALVAILNDQAKRDETRIKREGTIHKVKLVLSGILLTYITFVAGSAILNSDKISNTINGGDTSKAHIATIDLKGAVDGVATNFITALHKAYDNKNVKTIVINADSPGGSPTESELMASEILKMKARYPNIPVITSVGSVCASACYYVAAQTYEIYMT